jgi:hypothetical protein
MVIENQWCDIMLLHLVGEIPMQIFVSINIAPFVVKITKGISILVGLDIYRKS